MVGDDVVVILVAKDGVTDLTLVLPAGSRDCHEGTLCFVVPFKNCQNNFFAFW